MQSIPDDRNAARAYLLHRGVSAAQVFWAKNHDRFCICICVYSHTPDLVCVVVEHAWGTQWTRPPYPSATGYRHCIDGLSVSSDRVVDHQSTSALDR